MRFTDLARRFEEKSYKKLFFLIYILQKFYKKMVQTDKKCQHPAGEGTQGASKIDRTFHFSNTEACVMCRHAIYDMEYGSMFCRKHKECTREYYTCKYWIRNA